MDHAGAGLSSQLEQAERAVDVDRQGVARIGIEVGQSRAVDDQVGRIHQARARFRCEAQVGPAEIARDRIERERVLEVDPLEDREERIRSRRWRAPTAPSARSTSVIPRS